MLLLLLLLFFDWYLFLFLPKMINLFSWPAQIMAFTFEQYQYELLSS